MEALLFITAFVFGWYIRAESERIRKIRRANARKKAERKAKPGKRQLSWAAIKALDPDKKLAVCRE